MNHKHLQTPYTGHWCPLNIHACVVCSTKLSCCSSLQSKHILCSIAMSDALCSCTAYVRRQLNLQAQRLAKTLWAIMSVRTATIPKTTLEVRAERLHYDIHVAHLHLCKTELLQQRRTRVQQGWGRKQGSFFMDCLGLCMSVISRTWYITDDRTRYFAQHFILLLLPKPLKGRHKTSLPPLDLIKRASVPRSSQYVAFSNPSNVFLQADAVYGANHWHTATVGDSAQTQKFHRMLVSHVTSLQLYSCASQMSPHSTSAWALSRWQMTHHVLSCHATAWAHERYAPDKWCLWSCKSLQLLPELHVKGQTMSSWQNGVLWNYSRTLQSMKDYRIHQTPRPSWRMCINTEHTHNVTSSMSQQTPALVDLKAASE